MPRRYGANLDERVPREVGRGLLHARWVVGDDFEPMLKEGTRAVVEKNSYDIPPIFRLLASTGKIEEKMMYNTYNMGIGMCLAVDKNDADKTLAAVKAAGEDACILGFIDNGEKDICIK